MVFEILLVRNRCSRQVLVLPNKIGKNCKSAPLQTPRTFVQNICSFQCGVSQNLHIQTVKFYQLQSHQKLYHFKALKGRGDMVFSNFSHARPQGLGLGVGESKSILVFNTRKQYTQNPFISFSKPDKKIFKTRLSSIKY